jgi:hypothetical protein
MAGLVLVWDMDNTLSGEYSDTITLNPNALRIFSKAIDAKKSGTVSAIFLLTNNSDLYYIDKVRIELLDRLGLPITEPSPAPFNYIMARQHTNRPPSMNPPKRLEDIEFMMNQVNKGTKGLAERVFFFDDIPTHVLRNEIPPEQYIQIYPPFIAGTPDSTDYSLIERRLSPYYTNKRKNKQKKTTQKGGRRLLKTSISTKKKRKTRRLMDKVLSLYR